MPTFEPWANFKQALKDLQAKLEPGITVSLRYDEGILYPQYTVRAQRKGKRETLGTFYTVAGANDALYSFKRTGAVVINDEEYKAAGVVKTLNANMFMPASHAGGEKLAYDRIVELLGINNMHTWQLFGEEVIRLVTEDEAVVVYLTPARQTEFNKEHNEALDNADTVSLDIASLDSGNVKPYISDADYNKMLGLDDEET
jgi:hypothetical protein